MKHAVIEDSSIELLELFDELNKEASIEKRATISLNRMIYWWTRKPLVVGRAMALVSTLDNIKDVKTLLGLSSGHRAYQYVPDVAQYEQKLGIKPEKIKVLDPFAGAGSLVFPAAQLGLDVTVSDYNPLAYLIERSVLEFPSKYGPDLVKDFEKYARIAIEKTQKESGKFFKPKQLAYLWCWCITCPHCKQRVPLANHMYIAKTSKKKIGFKIIPKDKNFTIQLIQNISEAEGKKFTQKGGSAICITCKNAIDWKTMTEDIAKNKDREMIAIQIQKQKNRDYVLPLKEDKKLYDDAVKFFHANKDKFEKQNLIPHEEILPSHRKENALWHYGIKHWNEYFDERQLLVLALFLQNISQTCSQIKDESYRKVIVLYFSAILSKRVNMSGFGVAWASTRETPAHVLTFRRPGIAYNFAESNPFEKVAGSFSNILKNMSDGISFATRLKNQSKCNLESITNPSKKKYDLIITDPPYGDDVQYGELSEFFYVWVYRAIKKHFPKLPARVSLDEDFCTSWGRFGDKRLADEFFAVGLKKSFVSLSDKLKDDGLVIVFFAHSSPETWNLFLESIRVAKLKVVSSYSIHTESTSNVIARGRTSFMTSIVVVCRKILKPSEEYFEDIIPKIEDKIKNMMKTISNEKLLALSITELLIMVYGKVLESCTQHTVLKSYQKDFVPNFETLIKDARSFIMKQLVEKITGKSMNVIGPKMSFYILIKIFHEGIISGDHAIKITQTYDVKMANLEKENIIIKNKSQIRLAYLNEIEMDYSPESVDKNNMYQQLCYLAHMVDSDSKKIQSIVARDNFRIQDLKQIISLLIKNYHLKRNKGKSLSEKEQKELDILETLADMTGVKIEGTIDSYM